jgi:hypothetical protein
VTSERLTVPEKLLIAALDARKRSATFTAEDLVVAAWKLFPDTFGLSGYSNQFPDSNRVLTNIMGTKGMRGKGWLRKVGEKQYQLTSAGLDDGDKLYQRAETRNESQSDFLRAELDRQASAAIGRIISTPAARKAFARQLELITFNEACGFWDITVRSNANTLNARLAEVSVLLDRVATAAISDSEGLKVGSTFITKYQIDALVILHKEMQFRFKSDLDFIRKRTDERLEKKVRPIS